MLFIGLFKYYVLYSLPRWFCYSFQRGRKSSQHTESVSSSSEERADMSALARCTHEKADLSLHGHRERKIESNDTDVVVLAISIAPVLSLD